VDGYGNIYIADLDNFRVREISSSGLISTFAGNGGGVSSGYGTYSGDNGSATAAGLNFPYDVAIGPAGIYIADRNNNRIRLVSGGNISTVVGDGTPGFAGDGDPAADCQLSAPGSITLDANGNLYIADELNNRIREVTGTGVGVSVPTPQPKTKIAVYPNPSEEYFTVAGVEPADMVTLYDLYGQQLYSEACNGNLQQIDISGLARAYISLQWPIKMAIVKQD